ncbi:hypothetical protein MKZ38_004431 [Zalerion maritima]|uniref:Uncharacterized protein n=1 Tax=Zalerion maritima TaxID=339359 RepID=A0AAD5S4C5_9PEZI|nr:hypothetical protein MKZ38_004431 [Zalerion maritima]
MDHQQEEDVNAHGFDKYRHLLQKAVGLLPEEAASPAPWKARYDKIKWKIPNVHDYIEKAIRLRDHFNDRKRAWVILGYHPDGNHVGSIPGIEQLGIFNPETKHPSGPDLGVLPGTEKTLAAGCNRRELEQFFNDILFQLWPHAKVHVPEMGEEAQRFKPVFSEGDFDSLLQATRIVLRAMNKAGGYRNQLRKIGQEMPWLEIKIGETRPDLDPPRGHLDGQRPPGDFDKLPDIKNPDASQVAAYGPASRAEEMMSFAYHHNLEQKEKVLDEFEARDDDGTERFCQGVPITDADGWSLWSSIAWWLGQDSRFDRYWSRSAGLVGEHIHTHRAPLAKADLAYWYEKALLLPNSRVGRLCHRRYYVLELESNELVLPKKKTGEIYDAEREREVGGCRLSRVLFGNQINAAPGLPGAAHLKLLLNLLEVVADFYGVEIILLVGLPSLRDERSVRDWFVRGPPAGEAGIQWFFLEMEPGHIIPVHIDAAMPGRDKPDMWPTHNHIGAADARKHVAAASQILYSREFPGRPWKRHSNGSLGEPVKIRGQHPWERADCRSDSWNPAEGGKGLNKRQRFYFFAMARVDMPIPSFDVSAKDLGSRNWTKPVKKKGHRDDPNIPRGEEQLGVEVLDGQYWESPDGRRISRTTGKMFYN